MKQVIILGGIGNGSVIAHAIRDTASYPHPQFQVAGFLNDRLLVGTTIEGFPVLGKLQDVHQFLDDGYLVINTIYRIDGNSRRIKRFEKLAIPWERMATFIHPRAYVAPGAKLHPGCVVLPNASISPGAEIGTGSLIMVNATVGHNSILDSYCHCAAQSCISSFVKVGKGVHIGLNATVGDGLKVGDFSTLAMGSLLTRNLPAGEIWAGNPARFLREIR